MSEPTRYFDSKVYEDIGRLSSNVESLSYALRNHMEEEKQEGARIRRWLIILTGGMGAQLAGLDTTMILNILRHIM